MASTSAHSSDVSATPGPSDGPRSDGPRIGGRSGSGDVPARRPRPSVLTRLGLTGRGRRDTSAGTRHDDGVGAHAPATGADPSAGRDPVDPASRAALARLELVVTRRLDGMLFGDHRGLVPGPGTEPGDAREYQVGDDVRTMDWSVTARTTVPHIRQRIADRELETWVVVDLSPSVDVAGTNGSKRRLVLAALATVGYLAAGDGSRIGGVVAGAGRPRVIRAAGGSDHVRRMVEDVASTPSGTPGYGSALAAGLLEARAAARRTGLVVVVSDFLSDLDWERTLRTLAPRHEILAVHVADPLDLSLPVVGAALMEDAATGEVVEVDVDPRLAADYARASAAHREAVRAALRRCAAPVLALRTDRDWVRDVLSFVALRRRGGLPGGQDLDRAPVAEHGVGAEGPR